MKEDDREEDEMGDNTNVIDKSLFVMLPSFAIHVVGKRILMPKNIF